LESRKTGFFCEKKQKIIVAKCQALFNCAQFHYKVLTFSLLIKQRVPFNYCVVLTLLDLIVEGQIGEKK